MANSSSLSQGNLTPAVNYGKIFLMFAAIGVVSAGSVIGYIYLQSHKQAADNQQRVEDASEYIPNSYFPTFERKDTEDKRNQPDAKTAIVYQNTPTTFEQDEPKSEENLSSESRQYSLQESQTESTPPPLTAEEIALRDRLNKLKRLEDERRARLLARRGEKSVGWQIVESIPTIERRENPPPKTPSDRDFSSQGIEKDVSTYPVDLSRVITADRHIPCVLIEQINSQLEGRATCITERNVYGFHGRNILVPAGSKFMGKHGTLKKVGDERFNIDWTRMLRPDGVHVSLTEAYTSDRTGATGVEGIVNNRTWEKYGGAILTATVSAASQMSIASKGSSNTRIAVESYSTDLGRVASAMLQENINIKPYSIVPAGTRINITPTTDIWLKNTKHGQMFAPVEENQ